MTPLPRLEPAVGADQLYPTYAAFMARSDLHQTRLLGYQPLNLDAVTTCLLGLLGTLATVRHRSGATEEILTFLADAGLQIEEEMYLYETAAEAEAIADDLIVRGKRLFWPYPLREGRFTKEAHLVPPVLWALLNSKENLCNLVPAKSLASSRLIPLAELGPDLPERPAYLKAAGHAATGWGYSVRYACNDEELMAARADFTAQGVDRILVEEAVDVTVCWCANLNVLDTAVTYLGAAEQIFSAPAQQSGSVIDPEMELPAAGIALAMEVAEVARREGFRGVCGLDIGQARDGRLIVFDPNFRFNASTAQVLLHPAAVARSGLGVSTSFSGQSTRPMADVIAQIAGPVADGWFVPTRLLDQALLLSAGGTSLCTGFVMGRTRAETQIRATALEALLA
jgi:hypothetical protein